MSAYAAPGEPICGDPYPLGGKPCQLPPDHWDEYPHHGRPASGGFDAWGKPYTAVPAWMGLAADHLIEDCPHRVRTRAELEHHGWWCQCIDLVDPDGGDLCGWCVRVWKARNRKATT